MNHALLRFKSFVFPTNPSQVQLDGENHLQRSHIPFATEKVIPFGRVARVVSGKGKFVGSEAVKQSMALQALFQSGEAGMLYISGFEPMNAIMSDYTISQVGGTNEVQYTFKFVEVVSKTIYRDGKQYITVPTTKTLWEIASEYNITIDTVMELNPQFMTPWARVSGAEVRIR